MKHSFLSVSGLLAAKLDEVGAWANLGRMELKGEGGPVDILEAARWLQKAADKGDGMSCLYLAKLYHTGEGVPQDKAKATAMLEKACGLGVEPACLLLKQGKH